MDTCTQSHKHEEKYIMPNIFEVYSVQKLVVHERNKSYPHFQRSDTTKKTQNQINENEVEVNTRA